MEDFMEKVKHLNVKMKINGLGELEDKFDLLNYLCEMLNSNIKSINRLVEEINQTELVIGVDRNFKKEWKLTRIFLLF